MLTVSDAACQHLTTVLDQMDKTPDGAAIRIVAGPQGLGMSVDTPNDGDKTIEHQGKTILLLDENVSNMLDERTLDVQETEQGTALALK